VNGSGETVAAANTRPNARQPTTANTRQASNSITRQAEKPNARQPTQTAASVGDRLTSSNTRQRIDGYLGNAKFSNARQVSDGHLEKPADGHLSQHPANTRQVINPDAAFNYEAQLLRLETYKDRYGRTICKRVVRFVRHRTGRNIGEVTPELAESLSRRPGKGRTAEARAEAERNRLLAESLAKRLRGAKASGRRASARTGRGRRQPGNIADAFGSELLSGVSDFSRDERATYVH
jgi:hypothetical protein